MYATWRTPKPDNRAEEWLAAQLPGANGMYVGRWMASQLLVEPALLGQHLGDRAYDLLTC